MLRSNLWRHTAEKPTRVVDPPSALRAAGSMRRPIADGGHPPKLRIAGCLALSRLARAGLMGGDTHMRSAFNNSH